MNWLLLASHWNNIRSGLLNLLNSFRPAVSSSSWSFTVFFFLSDFRHFPPQPSHASGVFTDLVMHPRKVMIRNTFCRQTLPAGWLISEWENCLKIMSDTAGWELCCVYLFLLRIEDPPEHWAVMNSQSSSQLCRLETVVLPVTGPLGSPDHLSTPGTHTHTHMQGRETDII